jgi:Hemolysin activation/secretion protein
LTVVVWGLLLLSAAPAWALSQADIDAGNRAAQQIQNQQQERQQEQLRQDALRRNQTTPQESPQAAAPSVPKSGVCREIKQIVLTGVKLLPEAECKKLVTPYENRCLYAEDIEKLLADILKAYMDRGYVAVRPYVQAQDISNGKLEILIVEGRVEGLRLDDGHTLLPSANLTTAFPFVAGRPLDLRDIEQGLDQINRLASNHATMDISPGAESGSSVVTIKNEPTFPVHASAGYDNLGGLSTGRFEGSYTLSLDNPLRLNDFITYTHRNTMQESSSYRDSVSDSFFYSLPFGRWTAQFSYSATNYHSPVTTSSTTLVARGNTDTFRAELNYVVFRDQNQKLVLLAALNNKSTRNYLADEYLSVSSRKLSIADADANWSGRFFDMGLNAGLGLSQGVRQFDAKTDTDGMAVTAPHAQAGKLRYSLGLTKPFDVLGQGFSFNSQFTGQYAFEPLYGSEQITLGSYYTVRGFNHYSFSGDRGWYVRNELTTDLPAVPMLDLTPRPFLAFDGGRIEGFKNTLNANLTGVAGGMRLAGTHFTGELSAAKALSIPVNTPHEPVQFALTMNVSF